MYVQKQFYTKNKSDIYEEWVNENSTLIAEEFENKNKSNISLSLFGTYKPHYVEKRKYISHMSCDICI